jgi:hypothetical protein
MLSTNLITFEISFQNNGSETLIFNVSNDSLNALLNVLKYRKLYTSKIKEFDRTQSKFKTVSKKRLLQCIDYHTELFELLK